MTAIVITDSLVDVAKEPAEVMLVTRYVDSFDPMWHELPFMYKAMNEVQEQSHD